MTIAIAAAVLPAGCTDWDSYTRCHGGACDDGAVGGGDAGAECPGNLVDNPGFEETEAPWVPDDGNSSIERVAGGHGSGSALEVCGSAAAGYGVADNAPSVSDAAQGDSYRLRAWLRTDLAEAQTVRLLLREKTGAGGFVTLQSDNLDPSSGWTEAITPPLAVMADGNTLSISVVEEGPEMAGRCFQVDDLCLQKVE